MATPPDYRKILTELYEQYNPEKVKDVEFLLKKFAGREQEMIEKIRLKYESQGTPTAAPEKPVKTIPIKKFLIGMLVVLGLGAATFGGILLYETIEPGALGGTEEAPRDTLFVIADTVFARTECGAPADRSQAIPYGEAIVVYERDSAGGDESCIQSEKEGNPYFLPVKYLGTRRDFIEMDAIYGNDEARALYDNSFEKRVILDYYRKKGIQGGISGEWQQLLYDSLTGREQWQVFGNEINGLDAVAKGRFTENWEDRSQDTQRPLDFAVIIAKVDTSGEEMLEERPLEEEDYDFAPREDNRRLLLFSFDSRKNGRLIDELNLSNYPSHYIRPVKFSAESYWWGNYLRIDPDPNDVETLEPAILLEDTEEEGGKHLIEVKDGHLQITHLRQTIFGYARDNTVIP